MQFIDRSSVAAPPCLERYQRPQGWGDVEGACRSSIVAALEGMQGERCAYCQSSLEGDGRTHIEHFRQRSGWPQYTFSWDNMFRSCRIEGRCGVEKDKIDPPARMNLVVKPDVDDPLMFLRFRRTGEVEPQPGLPPHNDARAKETIRVFVLNHAALVPQRKNYIEAALQEANEILALGDTDPDVPSLIAALADDYRNGPFGGAVVSVLT